MDVKFLHAYYSARPVFFPVSSVGVTLPLVTLNRKQNEVNMKTHTHTHTACTQMQPRKHQNKKINLSNTDYMKTDRAHSA